MTPLKKITSFLRDCLRHERAGAGIPNLFANRIINRRFIVGEESATSHEFASLDLPPFPLPRDYRGRFAPPHNLEDVRLPTRTENPPEDQL